MSVTVGGQELGSIEELASNEQVGADLTAAWANSAAVDTPVSNNLAQPLEIRAKYRVQVQNPSTETALTIKVKNKVTIGGAERLVEVASIAVAANSEKEALVEGMFGGDGGVQLTATNDTAVGLTGAFTANLAVREA